MSDDTIDGFEEPLSSKISVTYPNGKVVEFGGELTPTDVKNEPQVSWQASPDKYYTLVMYDPDAPSKEDPRFADVKHWLVVNILGCDLGSGEVVCPYAGSGPPKDSGLHRYIFLVFEQEGKKECSESKTPPNSREHRINWSVRKFRKEFGLKKVFAGNYFQAQWDPYVDERKKQMQGQ